MVADHTGPTTRERRLPKAIRFVALFSFVPPQEHTHKNAEAPFDPVQLAALVAHQLRSPIAAAASLLEALAGEFAGPLSPRQKELLAKAISRCDEAIQSTERILTIANAFNDKADAFEPADVVELVRRAAPRWCEEAAGHGIFFSVDAEIDRACVALSASALLEVLEALVGNAIKYTPRDGRACLCMERCTDGELTICVTDSGIGVAEQDRARIFAPFYRSQVARSSSTPGTGLGLSLVRTVVEKAGGRVWVEQAGLGGAEFVVRLPVVAERSVSKGDTQMPDPLRVVIVGGVAAGPKVASKIIRLMPDAQVTIVEKGKLMSYAGCGLPYYISGVVKEQKELMCTPVGVVRDPVFFQKVKNVRVLNQTEALEIDRPAKRLRIRNEGGRETWLGYDKLVLATGATPVVPPIPNVHLGNIFTLHGVHDAEGIKAVLAERKAHDVVIVGGGLIGVEVTEAMVQRGCRVTIVEMLPQILRILDWELAKLVEQHMESHGVRTLTGTKVVSFEGDGTVARVKTDSGLVLPADMAILAIGVRPCVDLGKKAGLEIGQTGALRIDEHLRTSDPDIYAAGDCVESTDLLTGKPCYVPMGSTANKHGRVAAVNICGGNDTFPGVLGSTVCKVFDYCVARTGLTEAEARKQGYEVVTALAPAPDRAHFMPTARSLILKLIADARTRRLIGAQAIGPGEGDKRIDVAAMAISAAMTVDQLANVDLCYAPPYSPAMDNIITAANVVRNKLDGHMHGVTPMEVKSMLDEGRDFVLLDVRSPAEYDQVHLPHSTLIPLGALRGRMDELPKDKEIVTFCKISLRGYEAALILKAAGFHNVRVMDGGIATWPYERIQ